MAYVSFISAPGCLAAAAGLVAPLRPRPDDHVVPFHCLRHGQTVTWTGPQREASLAKTATATC